MGQYLLIRCPRCGKRSAIPADGASRDALIDRVSSHLYRHHPSISPAEAEDAIDTAVEGVEPAELDEEPPTIAGWD